jgi:hypothetical protein
VSSPKIVKYLKRRFFVRNIPLGLQGLYPWMSNYCIYQVIILLTLIGSGTVTIDFPNFVKNFLKKMFRKKSLDKIM